MAPEDTRRYEGISREVLRKLKAGLASANIPFPDGDSGTISAKGLSGSFVYDETAQALTLSIAK